MQPNPIISRNPAVVFRHIGQAVYLKLLRRAALSKVNEEGARLWDFLDEPRTWAEISAWATAGYAEAEHPVVLAGTERFIHSLIGMRFLQVEGVTTDGPVGSQRPSDNSLDECKSSNISQELADALQPIGVKFSLTSACNQKCYYCYSETHTPGQMSTEQWLSAIDQSADMGVLSLTLTGGEIFVRKDILKLIERATKRGFALSLQTNGSLITPEIADVLARSNVTGVQVSILGANAESHDRLAGVRGVFDKTLAGVRLLIERGIPVTAKTVLSSLNFHEVYDIVKLCKDDEMKSSLSLYVGSRSDGTNDTHAYRISREQIAEIARAGLYRPGSGACSAGTNTFAIGQTGDVYPCELARFPMGNVKETALKEIWTGEAFTRMRREGWFAQPVQCRSCEYAASCSTCPAMAWQALGRLNEADPEACRLTNTYFEAVQESAPHVSTR